MEVRFREPSRLYRLVLAALRSKFLAGNVTTRLEPRPASPPAEFAPFAPAASATVTAPPRSLWADPPPPRGLPTGPAVARPEPAWEADEAARSRPAEGLAVQMHDRYIVVETPSGIDVIDQHALHERLLYEKFKAAVEAGGLEVQPLLVPERLDLAPAELELVDEHAATLARAGMRVEPFGGSTVIVTSKPALAGDTPAAEIVREVLDRLAATAASGTATSMLVDEVLHGLACKAAIKAGDRLSQAEVDALVRERRLVEESHHCPHGRPTSLTLSRQDLDRQFRRT